MNKTIKSACGVALCVVLTLSGCTAKPTDHGTAPSSIPSENENPFEIDPAELFGGSVGHGFLGLPVDKQGDALPIVYTGGELEVPYYVNASGNVKELGLLLFIDGIPHPFQIGESDLAYLGHITLAEDYKDEQVTLRFTPRIGTKGDLLNICVTSITRPDFKPDLITTASYGFYHQTLPMMRKLRFDVDAPAERTATIIEALKQATVTAVPLTQSYLEGVDNGLRGEGVEKLDNPLIVELFLDDEDTKRLDSMQVGAKETLKICYRLMGTPGARYQTTFYLDHQPLSASGITAFETELTRESVMTVEAELDLSKATLPSTFYAITTLCSDEKDVPDAINQYKSRSLLIY